LPKVEAVNPPPDGAYPNFTTAEGQKALFSLTTGSANTAVGWYSLFSDAAGNFNTATGAGTLLFNTADNNTAFGAAALLFDTTGGGNTANGVQALFSTTTGGANTATGYQALPSNTVGSGNTAIDPLALPNNTTGNDNIALGDAAGLFLTGHDNIDIGNNGVTGESETTRIGSIQGAIYLAGIAGQIVGVGGTTCYVDNDGKLGVFLSSRRFKTDIADMAAASEALLALRPITFHYKPELDKTCTPQFGLVAEEVAKVNPDLVTRDAKGELTTVRYEAVNVMLLNEFLKEHKKVAKQEATITQLKNDFQTVSTQQTKEIQLLSAQLTEQAAQIQKVSAQLAATSPSRGGLEAIEFATVRIRRGGLAPPVVNNPDCSSLRING